MLLCSQLAPLELIPRPSSSPPAAAENCFTGRLSTNVAVMELPNDTVILADPTGHTKMLKFVPIVHTICTTTPQV